MRYIILTLIFANQIIASGGSLYTRYGLGDLYHSNSAVQLSLGGLGVSLNSNRFINTNNPASIFNIPNTKYGASVSSNISSIDDGFENSVYSHVKFTGFHIAFPVLESKGMGFILGMKPYSVINYEVNNKVINSSGDDYDENFKGSGGLSKVFFGLSYLLPFDIAFGATFDYYTGNVQYSSAYSYADSSSLFNSNFLDDFQYKGLGTTLGLESPDLAKIFNIDGITNFRVGLSYEISGKINTDSALVVRTTIGENTFQSGEFKTNIPYKLGIGLNLTYSEKYLLVLDYLYQPWSKFEQYGRKSPYLRNLSRYSFGFEIGDQTKRFASFWELVKYRGGLSYEQSQYLIGGNGINQFGIHAGLSFPLGLENSLDIGFMYGVRGTTDSNLLKENIFQASFSLNFGELWFIRQER